MIIIAIAVILVIVVLFLCSVKAGENSDRDAVKDAEKPRKMVPVKFNIDNSKHGRRRTTETENIPVQPTTVKTTNVPVVVETDVPQSPQIEQSNAPILVVKNQKPNIGVVECHGKNAGLAMVCTIVQKCSNGSLILNTRNGPIRKKRKYVLF